MMQGYIFIIKICSFSDIEDWRSPFVYFAQNRQMDYVTVNKFPYNSNMFPGQRIDKGFYKYRQSKMTLIPVHLFHVIPSCSHPYSQKDI